ncbi:uncharacterized protein PGTG_06304 [Puccinia graminis f. sp. tritici CRL 75-36-700-3]|uniref:Uncharacterized protein n=1 Tax=Puccinia graminis f. sp. tritici (strain CRL 75-36-700-3 / race SCCL) TaxID=418459 RepID=E3K7Q0_PUCGT|nr:uncharacterized protein PGTG_06304 [Puccinia graminis f. sp. tritici CRL 75-36-700-3]EFP80348.1 hypothetical protein PGTG_06304 [Puccinia graminis f. sp. tritici CRL 75-36-700-3]
MTQSARKSLAGKYLTTIDAAREQLSGLGLELLIDKDSLFPRRSSHFQSLPQALLLSPDSTLPIRDFPSLPNGPRGNIFVTYTRKHVQSLELRSARFATQGSICLCVATTQISLRSMVLPQGQHRVLKGCLAGDADQLSLDSVHLGKGGAGFNIAHTPLSDATESEELESE